MRALARLHRVAGARRTACELHPTQDVVVLPSVESDWSQSVSAECHSSLVDTLNGFISETLTSSTDWVTLSGAQR